LPRCTHSPLESPLFCQPQVITRPLLGASPWASARSAGTDPRLPVPAFVPPPGDPGFLRSLGRYGVTAPVAPSVVSMHAPPWEQLPSPAETGGAPLKTVPHQHDPCGTTTHYDTGDFSPDPYYGQFGWNAQGELGVYGGKYLNPVQRPAFEWGIPFYEKGMLPRGGTFLGETNLILPKFSVFGDYRSAIAYNRNVGSEQTVWANRLNLDIDFWITATERFHMFWGPLDSRNNFSGLIYEDGRVRVNEQFSGWDPRTDTMFFEGDLGYIVGGLMGIEAPFDLPFAAGLIPLFFQNGIWMEDAFVGVAATIPARNNPVLDWSNYDTTVFVGFDEVTSNFAFEGDNRAANIFGFTTFIESRGGYLEVGYAFLDDTTNLGRSYHNVGVSYTRRYRNWVSNSVRAIVNTGQAGPREERTADGVLLLMENSFLTRNPYNVIPYVNTFAGFGTPQSAARLQGPLKNTGINFETDLLTGYPLLDDSANNTYGGAVGVDFLGADFEQQLILEFAFLRTHGDDASRIAPGDQYAVGARYQRPLSHTLIFRTDVMHGFLENSENITGARMELRRKF